MLKKKIWANFQRIIELFTQKIVPKLSKIKIWVWGPGSEIRDPEKPIPDPGSRGKKSTGSRIRIRNTEKKDRIQTFELKAVKICPHKSFIIRVVLSNIADLLPDLCKIGWKSHDCKQCCGSGMLILDQNFSIPDPG
jgi:hypothetical protein